MEYSVTGQMISLTKSDGSTATLAQENVYNQDGIRISREENGIAREYYYDSGVVAYTIDGSDISSVNILSSEGAAIGTYRGDDYYTYLNDIQGSTTNLVKSDGGLAAAYDYTDFGETTEITASNFDNQVCYTGGIYDEETELYYLNARYYDPATGRFISQDTYRGELNDPGQWHLYAYCANNPINYVDPSGHASKKIVNESTNISMKKSGVTIKINKLKWKRNKKTKKIKVSIAPGVKATCDFPGLVTIYMAYISHTDVYKNEIILFVSVAHFKEKLSAGASLTSWVMVKAKNMVTLKVVLKGKLYRNKKAYKSYIYSCKPKEWRAKNYK